MCVGVCVHTGIKPCSVWGIFHQQMEKTVSLCFTNSVQSRTARISWESVRWACSVTNALSHMCKHKHTHKTQCQSYIKNKNCWILEFRFVWIFCVCVLDFPERGAVPAVGGEAWPCIEHRCHDSAEIHSHVFCQKELYQVETLCDPLWSSLQRLPGQVMSTWYQ